MGTYCKNHPLTNHPRGFPKVKAAKEGEGLKGLCPSRSPVHQEGEERLAAAPAASRCIQMPPHTQRQDALSRRHPPASTLHRSSSSAETNHCHTGQHNLWQALPNGSFWFSAMKHYLFICASLQWWDLPSFMPWALPFMFLCPWPN